MKNEGRRGLFPAVFFVPQFAICNLRNLREHFLSKFRVKKVSGKTALTYTERVDTIKNVVLDLLTVLLVRLICFLKK